MTSLGIYQVLLYLIITLALVKPLGWYMAQVYQGNPCGLDRILSPIERLIYRICSIDAGQEMKWKSYLAAMLVFNLFGMLTVYLLQRFQGILPFNPQGFTPVPPDLAFNTAASFVTNTNWQAYAGESTMSYLTQMLALTVQNFLSAATGMAILMALIRGITNHQIETLGNFWVDITRGILYIFLPLSLVFSIFLVSQGVIQNLKPYEKATFLQSVVYQQPAIDAEGQEVKDEQGKTKTATKTETMQVIPMGPVASQVAIKQLGTNGGGYFNANSAHPFENPTSWTNFLEMLALLLIPAASCYTYGLMVGNTRQGWAILSAMVLILVPLIFITLYSENIGNPGVSKLDIGSVGNMEGKEMRIGIANSAIWAIATTATSNGSVNSMHDSFTPLGGLMPLWLIQLGEVIFGGVGSGLYGMLVLVIITVFVAGLMVGRSPEYLGKKIEAFEMKMAALTVLVMPFVVLILTAIAVVTSVGLKSIVSPGAHGFTEVLYAFSSMGNNNGSAFAGLNANTPFYNIAGGLAMLICRYFIAIPVLAIAGSLGQKKIIPQTPGTLLTDTALFVFLLISVTIVLGALTFFPALSLGPIAEQLMMWEKYGH
jgi:K+-transporting ATPase ATPase A chain